MRNLRQITTHARKVAAAATGPLGPIPIQRVVGSHFDFFCELKASGASWDQISTLLEREGLRNRKGRPVTAAVLRTNYARALNERKAERRSSEGHGVSADPAGTPVSRANSEVSEADIQVRSNSHKADPASILSRNKSAKPKNPVQFLGPDTSLASEVALRMQRAAKLRGPKI